MKETRKEGAQQNIKLSSVFVTIFLLFESHHEGSGHRQFAVVVQLAVLVLRSCDHRPTRERNSTPRASQQDMHTWCPSTGCFCCTSRTGASTTAVPPAAVAGPEPMWCLKLTPVSHRPQLFCPSHLAALSCPEELVEVVVVAPLGVGRVASLPLVRLTVHRHHTATCCNSYASPPEPKRT